jgi:ABC-type branched-subunit amino acid transport system permease subunit
MIIARAMAMACFTALKFLAFGLGALLVVLTATQAIRADVHAQPILTLMGAVLALAAGLACGWIARRFENMN